MAWNKQYFCRECGKPILAKTHKKRFTGLCQSCNMKKVVREHNKKKDKKMGLRFCWVHGHVPVNYHSQACPLCRKEGYTLFRTIETIEQPNE